MPQLAPRVLKNAEEADKTYTPASFNGTKTVFVDRSQGRFADQSTITETTRPTAKGNNGHKFESTLALPHPVVDQDGCCVDKDAPATSYINTSVLANKVATAAQLDDLIALYRSYVASSAFADLVKGGTNW